MATKVSEVKRMRDIPYHKPTAVFKPADALFLDALYNCIKEMEKCKSEALIAPFHINRRELASYIFSALQELELQGRLKIGQTINDLYYQTLNDNESKNE